MSYFMGLGAVADEDNPTLAASRSQGYPVVISPSGESIPLMRVINPSTGQYAPIDPTSWGLTASATVGYDQALELLRAAMRAHPDLRDWGDDVQTALRAGGVPNITGAVDGGLYVWAHGIPPAGVIDFIKGGPAKRDEQARVDDLRAVAVQRGWGLDKLTGLRSDELRNLLCSGNFTQRCPYNDPFIPNPFGGEPATRAATRPITKSETDALREKGLSEDAVRRIQATITHTAQQGGSTEKVLAELNTATPKQLDDWAATLPEAHPTIVHIDGSPVTDQDRANARHTVGTADRRAGDVPAASSPTLSPIVLLGFLGMFLGLRKR